MLVGQLLLLAFAARCFSPSSPPRVTSCYITVFGIVSSLFAFGLLPAEYLTLDMHEELQLWRVASAFFCCDGVGAAFALQLCAFSIYSTMVEERHFAGAEVHYLGVLIAGMVSLLPFFWVIGAHPALSPSHALTFYVIGLWSRSEPQRLVQVLNLGGIRAALVPWGLLAVSFPLTGSMSALYNVLGLGSAFVYSALIGLPAPVTLGAAQSGSVPPAAVDGAAAAAAAASAAAANVADSAPRRPPSTGSKSRPGPSPKFGGKSSATKFPAGRERWMRWAQFCVAMLLVVYHGSTRAAERRAERSIEMRTCKRLRDAMDTSSPMMVQLMAKLSETRSTATADAGTILSAWSFAVEHWQQASALKSSQTNINNMSFADADVTRQVVAQALGRSELSEDNSDFEVVTEIYSFVGMNRLVVAPASVPYFMTATRAFREHRARTLAACAFIKQLVKASMGPMGLADGEAATPSVPLHFPADGAPPTTPDGEDDTVSETYAAVNASLAEYDLPSHMSDAAVLAELLSLLELPRNGISFSVERLLLSAIRSHRDQRALNTQRSLAEVLSKLVAGARNDTTVTDASGKALLSIEEFWSPQALNLTVNQVMSDALQLMEVPVDMSDEDVRSHARCTHASSTHTPPPHTPPPHTHAYTNARMRRVCVA